MLIWHCRNQFRNCRWESRMLEWTLVAHVAFAARIILAWNFVSWILPNMERYRRRAVMAEEASASLRTVAIEPEDARCVLRQVRTCNCITFARTCMKLILSGNISGVSGPSLMHQSQGPAKRSSVPRVNEPTAAHVDDTQEGTLRAFSRRQTGNDPIDYRATPLSSALRTD